MKSGSIVSGESLLGHHLWCTGLKMNSASSQDTGCTGKRNPRRLDLQEKRKHESSDCHHPTERYTAARSSAPVLWVCVLLEGYCFLPLKPFIGQKCESSLISGAIHRLRGDGVPAVHWSRLIMPAAQHLKPRWQIGFVVPWLWEVHQVWWEAELGSSPSH